MWKKFFLSDLGDLYALVHCTLLDHPLALRPYVILQFPLQIILKSFGEPPPPALMYVIDSPQRKTAMEMVLEI